jgi:N-acetylglutamate synthase-like GNAT family acetyltransferase
VITRAQTLTTKATESSGDVMIEQLQPLLSRELRSLWVVEGSLKIYFRAGYARRLGDHTARVLDLASIEVSEGSRGQGLFTAALEEIEAARPLEGLLIENVLDKRFQEFFIKRGYLSSFEDCVGTKNLFKLWY